MAPSNASNVNSGLFGVYDSPTMLPRTPLAPETLLGPEPKDNDDGSTDNGSSNGDQGGPAMDPNSVLAAREKSIISNAMETLNRKVSMENGTDSEDLNSDEEMLDLSAQVLEAHLVPFKLATPTPHPSHLNIHFICETASRLLFLSVHWVRSIPVFSQLK